MDLNILLEKIYTDPKSPGSFASPEKLFLEAKKRNSKVTRKIVREFLKTQNTYTLHRRIIRKFKRLKTVAPGLHTYWQADLAMLDKLKSRNEGYAYILVCIDLLSRQIFCAPLKQKTTFWMQKGFNEIFEKAKVKPWKIVSDQGLEFTSKSMLRYFKENDILSYSNFTHPVIHAGVVERAIRTIKTKLYKYFTQNETTRWLEILDDIVLSINNSVCSSTKTIPSKVNFKNASALQKALYFKEKIEPNKSNIKQGDKVRIVKFKMCFSKGYLPNFTHEIFTVDSVDTLKDPVVYRIRNADGEILNGKFYKYELCPVKQNEKHSVRILKERKNQIGETEYLVHWDGYDSSYDDWIPESNLI